MESQPRGKFEIPLAKTKSLQFRFWPPLADLRKIVHTFFLLLPGGSSEVAPPVPIPNTVVKRLSADDTALVTEWENRSPPGGKLPRPHNGYSY